MLEVGIASSLRIGGFGYSKEERMLVCWSVMCNLLLLVQLLMEVAFFDLVTGFSLWCFLKYFRGYQ